MSEVDANQSGVGKTRQQPACSRARSAPEIDNAGRIEKDHLETLEHAGSHFPVYHIALAEGRGRAGKVALDGDSVGEKRFSGGVGRISHGFAKGMGLAVRRAAQLTDNRAMAANGASAPIVARGARPGHAMGIFGFLERAHIAQDCRLCGQSSLRAICAGCDSDLMRLSATRCRICALPLPVNAVCGRCLAHPPAFDVTCAALRYEFPATSLIQAYKYAGAVGLANTLATLLESAVRAAGDDMPDLLVAMPLARPRLAERGYNQAWEIARLLGRRLHLQLDAKGIARIRHGTPQAELPMPERRRNVHGAFVARRDFTGLDVAVVDDVMTTGATLDELAGVLKSAGAARVRNWVVARTPL